MADKFIDRENLQKENEEDVGAMNTLKKSGNPGSGQGFGRGGGRGHNKDGAFGTGGFCVCAKCGEKMLHEQGVKCTTVRCPQCGHSMVREELINNK